MSEICFITTCMGRLEHLRQTLGSQANQLQASSVLVDYSCPDHCGDWAEQHFSHVKVVRVVGKSRFNIAEARNIGAEAADAPWLCFIDADVALTPDFCARMLPELIHGHYYRPAPFSGELCGAVICEKKKFLEIGGYDTVFQGWGEEDLDLYHRFRWLRMPEIPFTATLLQSLPHTDELRVQFYDIKKPYFSWTINQMYAQAKLDLMFLSNGTLTLKERQDLYQRFAAWITNAVDKRGKREFKLYFRQRKNPYGDSVKTALLYSLDSQQLAKLKQNHR